MKIDKIIKAAVLSGVIAGNNMKADAQIHNESFSDKKIDKTEISAHQQNATEDSKTYIATAQDFQNQAQPAEYINFISPGRDYNGRLVFNDQAAYFVPEANCIVYNYYIESESMSKQEKSQIKIQNMRNCSESTQNHERNHAQLRHILQACENGDMVVKPSDKTKLKILAELCCHKIEQQQSSITNAINDFKSTQTRQGSLEKYYSNHYGSNFGSIQYALSATDKIPEKLAQTFLYQKVRGMEIDGESYFASYYNSDDNKYQMITLSDSHDNPVSSPEIIKKSGLQIYKLMDNQGKIMTDQNNKPIEIQQLYNYGYQELVCAIPNFDKKAQGYEFTTAENNYQQLVQLIAQNQNLSQEEIDAVSKYLDGLDLSHQDLDNAKIKEIREVYADSNIDIKQRTKQAYMEMMEQSAEKFNQETRPFLKQIEKSDTNFSIDQIKKMEKDYIKKQEQEQKLAQSNKTANFQMMQEQASR